MADKRIGTLALSLNLTMYLVGKFASSIPIEDAETAFEVPAKANANVDSVDITLFLFAMLCICSIPYRAILFIISS
tara:strand:- start:1056 stop:1283 length:228 start_codon:yes stop_codon:yes gene_type:complete